MAIEDAIQAALFKRVSDIVVNPTHPVAWPNADFTAPASHRWLRVNHFPTIETKRAIEASGSIEFGGFLQVDVFGPLAIGVTAQTAIAAQIAKHFRSQRILFNGGFRTEITGARVGPGLRDDPRWMIPVTITYRAFAAN